MLPLLLTAACGPAATDSQPTTCAAATGEPQDLLPWARLHASATQPSAGHGWPREAQDGAATLRDGDPETGWRPPEGEPATLEIDLQPWLGRPVVLGELELDWTGGEPDLSVQLPPACGLQPDVELDWDDPSGPLDLGDACAGCVQLQVTAGSDTRITALSMSSRDSDMELPTRSAETVESSLAPQLGSGVIEGFYGQPWSWRERQAALATLARGGMGLYLYGPKDDPLHRDQWREPYGEDFQQEFAALAALGTELGVVVAMGTSPFIDYDADSEDDYQALLAKLTSFAAGGATGVALLADDIEFEAEVQVDAALGAAHADVANRLLQDLRQLEPELRLWFVPTVYSDDRLDQWGEAPEYLAAIADLHPSIEVMWTGTGTFCDSLQASDLARFTARVGRRPVIWDNYWANDAYDLVSGRVHLAPYGGRDRDLQDTVAGIGANPMIQGALSRSNLGALAAWLDQPGLDEPDSARALAAELEAALGYGAAADADEDAVLVERVMEAFDGHALQLPGHATLDSAVDDLVTVLGGGGTGAERVTVLLPLLAELAVLDSELHHSGLDPDLVDELAFPMARVQDEALAGLWALTALGDKLAGGDAAESIDQAEQALDRAAESRFVFSTGTLQGLVDAVSAFQTQEPTFVPPVLWQPAPPACVAGDLLAWRPFAGASAVQVHGLPGASVEGDLLRWIPSHAGRWRALALARGPGEQPGWAWLEVEILCELE